jgi:lipoprotein signal peptidase
VVARGRAWARTLPARAGRSAAIAVSLFLLLHVANALGQLSADYVQNDERLGARALVVVATAFVVSLVGPVSTRVAGALLLGAAAANIADSHLWPGGVPDYIPLGASIWNLADLVIEAVAIAIPLLVVLHGGRAIRRRYRAASRMPAAWAPPEPARAGVDRLGPYG